MKLVDADMNVNPDVNPDVNIGELTTKVDQVDMSRVRRVLIIKLSAMGDVIHALPVAAALKDTYPDLEVSWAVEDVFAPLVADNPGLTHVFRLPKMSGRRLRSGAAWGDWLAQMKAIRRERFDLTLDLQGLSKSALIAAGSGARVRLGYHWLRELAPFIEKRVPQQAGSVHIVEQYLDVARFLGARTDAPRFPLHVPPEDDAYVTQLLCEAGIAPDASFVAINPASAKRFKEWGAAKYGRLMDAVAEEMRLPCVLVTADANVAAQVHASARRPFANLAGRTNLKQLFAVLRRCAVHVCGDTGSGHIAAAFARPVVSIVGPTYPERTCPYGQRANTLSRREQCDPACDLRHCQFAAPRCLEAVQVEDVLAALRQAVSSSLSS
jgi:heptosyltransferase-1